MGDERQCKGARNEVELTKHAKDRNKIEIGFEGSSLEDSWINGTNGRIFISANFLDNVNVVFFTRGVDLLRQEGSGHEERRDKVTHHDDRVKLYVYEHHRRARKSATLTNGRSGCACFVRSCAGKVS